MLHSFKAGGAGKRKRHFIVVEDMKVNLMLVTKILRKHGCEVFAALNGREAVEMMRAEDYAVVFMDCQMPEMDGFEATRIIRKEEKVRGRHTAIVALTADAMTGDREKCIAGGMDDYLNKPLKAEQITEMLRKWVPQSAHAVKATAIAGQAEVAKVNARMTA